MSQQINLYSPLFRKQEKVFSATTMAQALALIAAVVAVFYFLIASESTLLTLRAADSSRQLKAELERLKAYGAGETPAERARALAERRKQLESALAGHTQALAALDSDATARAEGYSDVLRALARVGVDGVWLTRIEFAKGKGELSLAGRATRPELIPAYLERLRSEKALRGREFSRLEVGRGELQNVTFTLSSAPAAGAK